MLSILDSEAALKFAVEEMIEGIQIIDFNWKYIYLNKAAARHGRKNKEELVGRTMQDCYPGIDKTQVFSDLEYVMKKRVPRRIENEFEYEDNKKCWFELVVEPFPDGILIRSVDITDRKKLEQQLFHSQKMEAIGRFAGSIAHDFSNKLSAMLAYCELAIDRIDKSDETLLRYTKQILDSVNQSSNLTRQLLAFSRRQVMDIKVTNLGDIVPPMIPSLRKLLGEQIEIRTTFSTDLANIKIDPSQLDQVVLNLCVNARDAMPAGGKLTIETKNMELDEGYCQTYPDATPGKYVMVSVSDTGTGISPDTLQRMFEPFFTTKARDKGSGLGLAIVHGIVKQSRGHISVYSELGTGSIFRVFFPVVDEPILETSMSQIKEVGKQTNKTIFVVEDEPALRVAFSEALKSAGFQVIVSDGDDVEKQFGSGKNVDLLLTDIILPNISGREVATTLKTKKPNLKTVFISGYIDHEVGDFNNIGIDSILIRKPTSVRNLVEVIQKVFSGEITKGIY